MKKKGQGEVKKFTLDLIGCDDQLGGPQLKCGFRKEAPKSV